MTVQAGRAPYVAGIDLGTTAIKVGVFDVGGRMVALSTREQEVLFPAPGWAEQSPARTWQLQCEAVREAMRLAGVPRDALAAVALSVQRGTVIAVDADGMPLTNHIVWMDRRGMKQVQRLKAEVGSDRYYDTAGHPVVPYTGISKVLWIQHEAPEIFERCRVVAPPQTLHLRWLGAEDFLCDTSAGTFFFPFNIASADWSPDLLAALHFPVEKLPRVVPSTTVLGTVAPKAAEECGLSSTTRIVAGGGDGQCAAVGSGVTLPGRVMINIGTAAGVQTFLDEPKLDPQRVLNCGAHVIPGAWEMEGHTQASGAVLRWVRDELRPRAASRAEDSGDETYDRLVAKAAEAPPGAGGLVVIPTFNGASAPRNRPEFRGVVLGLTLAHTGSALVRAVLEGISLELRWMLDAIRDTGVAIEEVRVVGGGSVSPFWNQIHADVLGIPIVALDVADAAVTGAAICAAVATGLYPDFRAASEAFVKTRHRYEPHPDRAILYDRSYEFYRKAFAAIDGAGLFRDLEAGGGA